MTDPEQPPITAAGDDASLLLVKEAVRQGELRLAAQAQARQVLEVRASAITQFLVTLTITLTAGQFTLSALQKAGDLPITYNFDASIRAVTTMTGFSTLALIVSIASLTVAGGGRMRPPWRLAGDNPRWIFDDRPLSEKQALLDLAQRYIVDIGLNEKTLSRMWVTSWSAATIFVVGIGCSYFTGWLLPLLAVGAGE
jgi:hypothetical protein